MNRPRTPQPPEKPTKAGAPKRVPAALAALFSGSVLTRESMLRNMPFILFCTALMLVYIGYGYNAERLVRQLHRSTEQLNELRAEHIVARERLEQEEGQSHVAADISDLGLKESRVPPRHVTVPARQLEQSLAR
jgi:hypothetical protein